MTKYRIRLGSGRVIGPFTKQQIFELKVKGHVSGTEEAQEYPTGSWRPMSEFPFHAELMDDNRTIVQQEIKEDTFVIDLSALRRQRNEKEIEKIDDELPPPENLTETVRLSPSELKTSVNPTPSQGTSAVAKNSGYIPSREFDLDISKGGMKPTEEEKGFVVEDKTQINPQAQEELRLMRKRHQEDEERAKSREEERSRKEEAQRQQRAAEDVLLPEISPHDSTQMLSLDKVKGDLLVIAEEEERSIEDELRLIRRQQKAQARREAEENGESEEDDVEEGSSRKGIILIVAAIILAVVFLFPAEEGNKQPPFQHIPAEVVFPVPFDKADPTASKIFYTKAMKLFADGTYPALIQAGKEFRASYENDVNNMAALNMMVRSYAEQLKHSKNRLADSQMLFTIIQSKKPFLLQDPHGVLGVSYFYMANDKAEAAVDAVSKYLKLNGKNVTQELFSGYLESLMKAGKLDLARDFATALTKAPQKNYSALHALIKYHLLNQEEDKALEYLDDGLKRYPRHVSFMLMKAEFLLKEKKLKEADLILTKANKLNLEYNDGHRAKFLELSGIYMALKGDVPKATKFLNASLVIEESSALRMKLAELSSSSGAPDANKLISESQSFKFLREAEDFYLRKSFQLSLVAAARAVDASPSHIPSALFLSKVQLRLGLTRQALKTLEDLLQQYPNDLAVNVAMISAYIETYKFNDAKTRISIISTTPMKESWHYASLNAHLSMKMNDPTKAISWLRGSIKLNPLNDIDVAHLADYHLKLSRFEEARRLLNNAIELDPVNPDHRILYARLIYQTQDDQAAVGYLLSLLDDFGESPKILGEIAISYFKSGRVKDFQDFKVRLEKLPTKDRALYEFLIKSALLDERFEEIPGLVEELLRIEPGSLDAMMTAGKVLFEDGKLVEAARWFKRVQEKLPSYPKVQYYGAKIKFLSGDLDGAKAEVENDMKSNGQTDASLVLLGEIAERKDDLIAAENYYKLAQKINPRSYEALMGLAELSTKRNNFDLALDLYKKAMKQRSDEPVVHKKIGDVYRLLGQGTLAIESYKLYLEMNPEASDKKQIDSYIQLMQ